MRIEVIVGLHETERPGMAALEDLPIPTEDGELVTLGVLAEVQTSRTRQFINRLNRKTTSWVTVQFVEEETTTETTR